MNRSCPEALYAPAINAVKEKDASPSVTTKIIEQLPTVNRKVVEYIANMVKEMTQPANSKLNRMGAEAFAVVFAPSFFRYGLCLYCGDTWMLT